MIPNRTWPPLPPPKLAWVIAEKTNFRKRTIKIYFQLCKYSQSTLVARVLLGTLEFPALILASLLFTVVISLLQSDGKCVLLARNLDEKSILRSKDFTISLFNLVWQVSCTMQTLNHYHPFFFKFIVFMVYEHKNIA